MYYRNTTPHGEYSLQLFCSCSLYARLCLRLLFQIPSFPGNLTKLLCNFSSP